ncbi:uncharacterized protein LOC110454070 isoform X2 [Mizuhopecten yessoensis]|uniref:uncharacterized protein LOC110454070 isoform X2 n=1 Tax=Mizuhopecten yessoensis TaxID=6573 RepID=UPI000B45CBDC|nr:uncharacterized protein LOC110454070 isoform X2 [Mizuhopecten yessoensis]
MLRWSVHALVVLYTVIWPMTVYGTDLDSLLKTHPLDSPIWTLIQKIDRQENRLLTLETVVMRHMTELEEKDRKIDRLVQELTEIKTRMGPVETSLDNTLPTEVEFNEKYKHKHVINETEQDQDTHAKIGPDYTGHDQHVLAPATEDKTLPYLTRPDHTRIQQQTRKQYRSSPTQGSRDIDNPLGFGYVGLKVKPNTAVYDRPTPMQHAKAALQRNGRAGLSSVPTGGIAFSLSLDKDTQAIRDHTIEFDNSDIDIGSGYEHADGRYRVPASGVYVFTWSIVSAENSGGNMITELRIDGQVKGSTNADSDLRNWESATGLVVTRVEKDNHVYIRSKSTGIIKSNELARSTFSGWRLF